MASRSHSSPEARSLAYLRDIEKLIRIALPREDRRTPRPIATLRRRRRNIAAGGPAPARTHRPAQMKPHRDRKALAVAAVPGGNNGAPQTNRHEVSRQEPQRPSQGGGKAEGMQGRRIFCTAESRPNTRPNRTQRPR